MVTVCDLRAAEPHGSRLSVSERQKQEQKQSEIEQTQDWFMEQLTSKFLETAETQLGPAQYRPQSRYIGAIKERRERMQQKREIISDLLNALVGNPEVVFPIYTDSGMPITGKAGQKQMPKLVTAEATFSGQFATIDLNDSRAEKKISVRPTSATSITCLGVGSQLNDTTKTPASYGWNSFATFGWIKNT